MHAKINAALAHLEEPLAALHADPDNARTHNEVNLAAIEASLATFGQQKPIVVNRIGKVIAGNGTLAAAAKLGWETIAVVRFDTDNDARASAYALADNRTAELAGWDTSVLAETLRTLDVGLRAVSGFSTDDIEALLAATGAAGAGAGGKPAGGAEARASLAERFLVPPFSVLDARQGYWRDRLERWNALGLKSGIGRPGANLGGFANAASLTGKIRGGFGESAGTSSRDGRKDGLISGGSGETFRDPSFYLKKKAVEAKLGRELSTEEFKRDHYVVEDGTPNGTSIFDPVLAEILYSWFCPKGGAILDPFAGGSTRGVVAGVLGRSYTGIDLRPEQVEANEKAAARIFAEAEPTTAAPEPSDNTPARTPVERRGAFLLKRDDLFGVAGVRGGKVRSCWHLAQGAKGLVTAGSRASPQVNIVAQIAKRLGIPCRVHVPSGALAPEVVAAAAAGAEVIQHPAGRNTVIVARAREDAKRLGWFEVPFGMECPEAVAATASQVAGLPPEVKRIVVPVGSGMSLAGILTGLAAAGRAIEVLGVKVGADPTKRLDKYAPKGWRKMVTLVESGSDYHEPATTTEFEGVRLDPFYEAKTVPFLVDGDLLWCVGIRQTETEEYRAPAPAAAVTPRWVVGDSLVALDDVAPESFDFVFSCPPYADLERYSDDAADLSTMDYDAFVAAYRAIIAKAVAKLRPDSFCAFVVGEVREKRSGFYRGFVVDTIRAFEDAGARLYNEAILVTSAGSLPIRATRVFNAAKKLGKTHQNVLVFVKGDPKAASDRVGLVDFAVPDEPDEEAGPGEGDKPA